MAISKEKLGFLTLGATGISGGVAGGIIAAQNGEALVNTKLKLEENSKDLVDAKSKLKESENNLKIEKDKTRNLETEKKNLQNNFDRVENDRKSLLELNQQLMLDNEQYALSQLEIDKEVEKTYDINLILNKLDDIVSNTIQVDISEEDRKLLSSLNKNLLTTLILNQSLLTKLGLYFDKLGLIEEKLNSK